MAGGHLRPAVMHNWSWPGYSASLPPARRFRRRCVELHGSTACSCILEEKLGRTFDLANQAEALEYAASGGPEACAQVVSSAVHIAAGLLAKGVSQRTDSESRSR